MFLLSPSGAKRIMMGDAAVCGKSSPACPPRVDRRDGNYRCSRGAAASAARVFGIRKFAICDPKYPRPFFGAGCVSGAAGENTCKKVFPLSGQRMFVENFFEGRRPISGESAFVRLCRAAINAALRENRGNMFPCKHKGKLLTRNAGLRHCAGSFRNVLAVRDTSCVSYDFLTFQPRRPRFQAFPCMPIYAFAVVLFL